MSELSPETEELLARGREGTPLPASRRDNLKGAVLAKLATGAIVTSSTSAAAWTATTKTIGVAVIAAVIGTGTVGVVKYERHARAPQVATQTSPQMLSTPTNDAPASPIASAITITPPTLALPPETPQSLPIVAPTPDVPPVVVATPQPIAPTHATSAATPSPISNDSPDAVNSPAIVTSPNSGSSGGTATTPSTTSHASSLAEETTLLRAAHEALLANDPARALRLLDEHAARFPSSALEPERSAERVFAFCAEQKIDSAHAAAGTFLTAHPTGPLASRVRASCGGR